MPSTVTSGHRLDGELAVDEDDRRRDIDVSADRPGEHGAHVRRFVHGLREELRVFGSPDEQRALGDPHRSRDVLRVDREHAARADDEMIDVRTTTPDHEIVQHSPRRAVQCLECACDELFPEFTFAPERGLGCALRGPGRETGGLGFEQGGAYACTRARRTEVGIGRERGRLRESGHRDWHGRCIATHGFGPRRLRRPRARGA